ncbi:MAG TPA: GAF domain-containing protein [Burkholderiaceae bacterium]|nr:GAF domain-containing protein [Burkholderiaceae bacterium]
MLNSPAFGQADLTNCERELIHLAGSIQPHGALLVLREADLVVEQASENCADVIGIALDRVLGRPLRVLGGDIEREVRRLAANLGGEARVALSCELAGEARRPEEPMGSSRRVEGTVHRHPAGGLILELEPIGRRPGAAEVVDYERQALLDHIATAVQGLGEASNVGALADAVVRVFRDLTGYDRVMVYRFDPDGHGEIIAEARHPRLDTLLGHHYPASDIPQRARELYVRNRVRVLVDVHYAPVPLVPRLHPGSGAELDMSMCYLRSMSPLHIQYLKNMGVNATLVVSLVLDGQLWGLVACHHDSPRNLRYPVRAACELLAEIVATRLAAIENYAHAHVAIQVQRLERRMIEATSTEGDWRMALFRNPRLLLQPLAATGAVLCYDGEFLTAGEAPSTPELRALVAWIDLQGGDECVSVSSIGRAERSLEALTPTASGILAIRLSASRPDYLIWLRKEQLRSVTWAGDPTKPVVRDDPMELSPRRSFAAWSEIVRGTAMPWSSAELLLARSIGAALVDIIVQVNAVRLLIAEHQLARLRAAVQDSREPVLIADSSGELIFANDDFARLVGPDARPLPPDPRARLRRLDDLASLFTDPGTARAHLGRLRQHRQTWRAELALAHPQRGTVPVGLRAEVVPGRDGDLLGYILVLGDLTERKRTAAALEHLEKALNQASESARSMLAGRWAGAGVTGDALGAREGEDLIGAILSNASVAAMDIAEGAIGPSIARLLAELEASTQRATALYAQIRSFRLRDSDAA